MKMLPLFKIQAKQEKIRSVFKGVEGHHFSPKMP